MLNGFQVQGTVLNDSEAIGGVRTLLSPAKEACSPQGKLHNTPNQSLVLPGLLTLYHFFFLLKTC